MTYIGRKHWKRIDGKIRGHNQKALEAAKIEQCILYLRRKGYKINI
jgi:hypothetical protein